jgi:DNA-binding NarL/FixJ family response regulator
MAQDASVFIVDDHPLVREALAVMIADAPGLALCGQAGTVADALRMIGQELPDVALIDLSLGSGSGLDLVRQIHVRYPDIKLLVVSMHEEAMYAHRARRAGALGYVNKLAPVERILDGIRCVLAGQHFFSETAVASEGGPDSLSNRETQIFELIGRGYTASEIGDSLHISVKTVETHRDNIRKKLGLASSHDLVIYAAKWFADQ